MYNSPNIWLNKRIDEYKIFNILDKLFFGITNYLNKKNIIIKDINKFKTDFYLFSYKYSNN